MWYTHLSFTIPYHHHIYCQHHYHRHQHGSILWRIPWTWRYLSNMLSLVEIMFVIRQLTWYNYRPEENCSKSTWLVDVICVTMIVSSVGYLTDNYDFWTDTRHGSCNGWYSFQCGLQGGCFILDAAFHMKSHANQRLFIDSQWWSLFRHSVNWCLK